MEVAAEFLFEIALSGHREAAGLAGFDGGMLLAKRGDERCIRALEISAFTNDPDSWPDGAALLAVLLPTVGREADGKRSLERARSSGNTRVRPLVEAALQQLGRT